MNFCLMFAGLRFKQIDFNSLENCLFEKSKIKKFEP